MENKDILIIAIFLLVISVVLIALLKPGRYTAKYKLKLFLTKNEKDCFNHLLRIFPEYYICPQVSMGAIIEPIANMRSNNANERSNSAIHRNQVQSKIIDFVVLDSLFNPLFIIELDDNTHNSKLDKDKERDINLSLAGLKTIRIRRNKNTFPTRKYFEQALSAS